MTSGRSIGIFKKLYNTTTTTSTGSILKSQYIYSIQIDDDRKNCIVPVLVVCNNASEKFRNLYKLSHPIFQKESLILKLPEVYRFLFIYT